MSMIECPECKKQVSDKAISCPHCGNELQTGKILCPSCRSTNVRKTKLIYRLYTSGTPKALKCEDCGHSW